MGRRNASGLTTRDQKTAFASREDFLDFTTTFKGSTNKEELIVEACRGKSVLDVGCIDHSLEVVDSLGNAWLHARIRAVARAATGLDILESEAAALTLRGFDVRAGDAESFDLRETFDVIVAGDIIEHLSCPAGFLTSCRRHMTSTSLLLMSTPNPFSVRRVLAAMIHNRVEAHPQHVAWFDPFVMYEMVTRHGFELVDFAWVSTRFNSEKGSNLKGRAAASLARLLTRWRTIFGSDFAIIARVAEPEPDR